jgi:alpha-glucoside transport system permease protein
MRRDLDHGEPVQQNNTEALTISNLGSSHGEGWQLQTTAAFTSMPLPLIIFFTVQLYFIRGIVSGSVKR